MSSRALAVLVAFVATMSQGCSRLPGGQEGLALEPLPAGGAIPSAYGRLVGVTSVGSGLDITQLWFQDDAGVIRLVVYGENRLWASARVIPRN